MVDKLIASLKGKNYDQYEIYYEEIDEESFLFKANRFYESKKLKRQGFGTRVVKDKKLGFISGTDTDLLNSEIPNLKPIIDTVVKLPGWVECRKPKLYSAKVSGWTEDQLKSFGEKMIDYILELNTELSVEAKVVRSKSRIQIANSEGLNEDYQRLISYFWVEAQLVKGDHILYLYDFDNISSGRNPNYQRIKRRFDLLLINLAKEISISPGAYPVIILPIPLSSLISSIQLGVSGKAMEKGYSPLIDKEGEKLLSDKVTIYDDGLLPFAFNSAPFDDEGVAKDKKTLFDKGIFKGFVFDIETALRNDRESSGNAQRSYTSLPKPGVNNFILQPDKGDLNETIKSIDQGILVAGIVGGGHGNPYAGDFSVKLDLGFLIKNGEIVGRITDTMMAGNCYQMLNNVVAIGNQSQDLGSERIPWVLVSELKFATPQQDLPPK